MKFNIETRDNVDMAEYANDTGQPLGTIDLQFGSVMDTDFEAAGRASYVESDFLGSGGFYATIEKTLAAIAHCVGHQEAGYLSEFVIPAHGETTQFLLITIDTTE